MPGKKSRRVFCDVEAYVSCRGYDGILLSAREISREFEVAPRIIIILYDSSLTEIKICQGLFYFIGNSDFGIRGKSSPADRTYVKSTGEWT